MRNLHDVLRKSTGPQRLGGKWPTFIPEADEAEQEGPHEPIRAGTRGILSASISLRFLRTVALGGCT